MTSVTSWTRLEPRSRNPSLAGAEARLGDPLWLLGRQWQVGELQGEDAGSPAAARITGRVGTLSRFATGDPQADSGRPYTPASEPLEALVEHEPVAPPGRGNVRLAAELGLAFWHELDAVGLSHRREDYLLHWRLRAPVGAERETMDPESLRTADLYAGRVIDGVALRHELLAARARGGRLTAEPQIDQQWQRARAERAADQFLAACDELDPLPDHSTSWVGERLEYRFAVSGRVDGAEVALRAPRHLGDRLDWTAFDIDPSLELAPAGAVDPDDAPLDVAAVPAPAAYAGMPVARFWAYEDGDVNFGALPAGREDLARMLLTEYALVYGNDAFVVPLDVPVGGLCRIDGIEVTDTFGDRLTIPSVEQVDGAAGKFSLFRMSGGDRTKAPLLVAPTTGGRLTGPVLEEVAYLRDDMANVAWAVERIALGPSGRPLQRQEAERDADQRVREQQLAEGSLDEPDANRPRRYRIATPPPRHWIPLVPVKTAADQIALEVRAVPDDRDPARVLAPLGDIIQLGAVIHEEEIPADGLTVTRTAQLARWLGGGTTLWVGRSRRAGQREGSSGLSYDVLEQAP